MSGSELPADQIEQFDFNQHRIVAETDYQAARGSYETFAKVIESILAVALDAAAVSVTSIQATAKTVESFGRKAAQAKSTMLDGPKYSDPLSQITDLAGARVITYFLSSVAEADR